MHLLQLVQFYLKTWSTSDYMTDMFNFILLSTLSCNIIITISFCKLTVWSTFRLWELTEPVNDVSLMSRTSGVNFFSLFISHFSLEIYCRGKATGRRCFRFYFFCFCPWLEVPATGFPHFCTAFRRGLCNTLWFCLNTQFLDSRIIFFIVLC